MGTSPLRKGLHFCLVGEDVVFLDFAANRYFRLSDRQARIFRRLMDAGPVDSIRLADAGLAMLAGDGTSAGALAPCRWIMPTKVCEALQTGGFPLAETARALRRQRQFEKSVRNRPLADLAADLARVSLGAGARPITSDDPAGRLVRAFGFASLLHSAADRCLPRSLALVDLLARRGWRAHVVLGVRQGPFAAHCWAQAGEEVLNDTVEEAACFTPILVL